MTDELPVELQIVVSAEDVTENELDLMTRNLLAELRDSEVESAELAAGESAPEGSKAVDPVTIGAIVIAVLPTFLPKIVEAVQAWALRGYGRTVKFKGMIGGQAIEFEGSSEDLQKLIALLSVGEKKK